MSVLPVQDRRWLLEWFLPSVKESDIPEAGVFRVITYGYVADKMKRTFTVADVHRNNAFWLRTRGLRRTTVLGLIVVRLPELLAATTAPSFSAVEKEVPTVCFRIVACVCILPRRWKNVDDQPEARRCEN